MRGWVTILINPFKGRLSPIIYLAVTAGVSLVAPLLILGVTIGLSLAIPSFVVDTTFLTVYFVITCTLYNLFLMAVLGTGHVVEGEDVAHYFSILVPAKNEESVIRDTLGSANPWTRLHRGYLVMALDEN